MRRTLFATAILLTSSARAAEVVSWDDLPEKIGHGKRVYTLDGMVMGYSREDRSYTIVTTSGKKFRLRSMGIYREGVRGDGQDIPGDRIVEIRIHHTGRFTDPLTQSFDGLLKAYLLFSHVGLAVPEVVIPTGIAYGLATPVPLIAIEGIRRLLPAKVIKVTH
jgi:hypothetical protein